MSMSPKIVLFAFMLFVLSWATPSFSAEDWKQIQTWRDDADLEKLDRARARVETLLHGPNPPDDPWEIQHYLAELCFATLEAAHICRNPKAEREAVDAGLAAIQGALKVRPDQARLHTLAGYFYGGKIFHGGVGGLFWAPASLKELAAAIRLDPNHGEAYTATGIGKFFTPPLFGGGLGKAKDLFEKASALDPMSATPHLWLARLYQKMGQTNEARAEIQTALRLEPKRRLGQFWKHQIDMGWPI